MKPTDKPKNDGLPVEVIMAGIAKMIGGTEEAVRARYDENLRGASCSPYVTATAVATDEIFRHIMRGEGVPLNEAQLLTHSDDLPLLPEPDLLRTETGNALRRFFRPEMPGFAGFAAEVTLDVMEAYAVLLHGWVHYLSQKFHSPTMDAIRAKQQGDTKKKGD